MTAPQVFARAWFSPFLRHRYCSAGTYNLTVSASDQSGQSDSMSLPIHVYPELEVAIVRHGGHASARVTGGDGVPLAYTWSLGGRRTAYSSSVSAPPRTRLEVTVSDAAGGTVSAKAPPRRGGTSATGRAACANPAKLHGRRRSGRRTRRAVRHTGPRLTG